MFPLNKKRNACNTDHEPKIKHEHEGKNCYFLSSIVAPVLFPLHIQKYICQRFGWSPSELEKCPTPTPPFFNTRDSFIGGDETFTSSRQYVLALKPTRDCLSTNVLSLTSRHLTSTETHMHTNYWTSHLFVLYTFCSYSKHKPIS